MLKPWNGEKSFQKSTFWAISISKIHQYIIGLHKYMSVRRLTAPWDMKQDNPYLLAQPGFEPTPSLGVSIHIKKDLNAKATEPWGLYNWKEWKDNRSFFLYFCLFFYWNYELFEFYNFFVFHYNFYISTVLTAGLFLWNNHTQI